MRRTKDLEAKYKDLEKSKKEMYTYFTKRINLLKKEIEDNKKGAVQLSDTLNSILIGVALDYDGEIKVPKNHMELLDMYDYKVTDDGENYYFRITPKGAEDDLPFAEGDHDEV